MNYDVLIIGGGLSGLTAGSLLAKRGVKTAVIDKSAQPGGSCGIFKRGHVTFDQGSAMMYGFGEDGFNAHRYVFNCLEEPIDMIRHDVLYCVNFNGRRITFWPDIDRFVSELGEIFPSEKENLHRFYHDMLKIYRHVLIDIPLYSTADEIGAVEGMQVLLRHPFSFARFLSFLNKSAENLLKQYFTDPEIFKFFDKLTSTYCYATVKEAPAVLAAVMFVDNHIGGSWYPAGSTLFVPGKLEKVIEENGGDMFLGREAVSILFNTKKPSGVKLDDGTELHAPYIIYSGTVWNLYGKLIDSTYTSNRRRTWAKNLVPTYASVVMYAVVDRSAVPDDTAPVEMLVGNPDQIDESELTAYILSIDDRTLCADDEHTVVLIGPTFEKWEGLDKAQYLQKKKNEIVRLTAVLERRFPGISKAVRSAELATPKTVERYNMKNGGAAAGPKQMLGQHMFKRLHIRSEWNNLFCCGESTVMGTGTPTVTTSGLTAANVLLKKLRKKPYTYRKGMKNFVNTVEKPFTADMMYRSFSEEEQVIMRKAMKCRFCEFPACTAGLKAADAEIRRINLNDNAVTPVSDIPGIMRRAAVGNFAGARKAWRQSVPQAASPAEILAQLALLEQYEKRCICVKQTGEAVDIRAVIAFLEK